MPLLPGSQPPTPGAAAPPAPGVPSPAKPKPAAQGEQIPTDDLGDFLSPGDPVGAAGELSGVAVQHFALKTGGPSGKPVGLMRVADDPHAEVLTMERFTPDGEWEDDPGLIDEMHQPGTYAIDPDEAQSIQTKIVGQQPRP